MRLNDRLNDYLDDTMLTIPKMAVEGDLNEDGIVSFDDFVIFSARFGRPNDSDHRADIDDNGVIEFNDFLILMKALDA